MTQTSGLWTTSGTPSGDQVASYTQVLAARMHSILAACSGFEGVAPGYGDELACSDGGSETVDVATGGAVVDGIWFDSDAVENVNVPATSADYRIDRIVVEVTWASFECEITRIPGSQSSSPTAPSIPSTAGTNYAIQLCQVLVDSGGNVTVTDERTWAMVAADETTIENNTGTLRVKDSGIVTAKIADLNVTTGKLAADAVTGAKIADDQINSEHYVAGSIDLEHMSANSVDSDQYVDGSIDTAHLANDAVDDTKVGNRVPQFYRRQGGSATIWTTAGTTDYTPTTVRMQAGAVSWTGSATQSDSQAVTFPAAFSYAPLAYAIAYGAGGDVVNCSVATTTTGLTIYWQTVDASTMAGVTFYWFAVGPE